MPRKPRDPNAPRDYEVGYGKPPKHSQFKRGQSGCPSGRPAGARSIADEFRSELSQRVIVNENGKRKRLTKRTLAVKSVVNAAARGDLKAFALMAKLEAAGPIAAPPDEAVSPEDMELLRDYFVRQAQEPEDEQ